MSNEVQSILNDVGLRCSALKEFITALLPILEHKIDYIMPDLLKNPSLLSHFVHENLVFDTTLREEYLYIPAGKDKWDGLTQHSLKSPRVFATWRDAEKNCPVPLKSRFLIHQLPSHAITRSSAHQTHRSSNTKLSMRKISNLQKGQCESWISWRRSLVQISRHRFFF